MAGIYGPIKENDEYPVTDERHFTVTILPHRYVEGSDIRRDACNECAFPSDEPFHCNCAEKHPFGNLDAHYTSCPLYKENHG
jgi:hypothetical protein